MNQDDIERLIETWHRGIRSMIEELETLIEEIDSIAYREAPPPTKIARPEKINLLQIKTWRSIPLPDT